MVSADEIFQDIITFPIVTYSKMYTSYWNNPNLLKYRFYDDKPSHQICKKNDMLYATICLCIHFVLRN